MITLSEKERMLLQDEKSHEELCVKKYKEYTEKANDPVLKNLFTELGQKESEHLNSINQILSGTVPALGQGGGQQGQQQKQQNSNNTVVNNNLSQEEKDHDKFLCQDALSTEKHVSSTYNTSIFEMRDTNIRQVLNHIQKEEQEHGEKIYNYMHQHGMY